MVKSLALGLSQIKAASEPPSWLDHLCDQTLTVRSSQLPYPWSARNTYCRNLDRNAVFSSTLGTLLGSERKPDSILPTHTFPSCSRLGKSCLSPPTLQKKKKTHIICSVTKRQCSVQADPGRDWPECSWARGGVGEAWSGAEVPAFESFKTPLLPKWELRVSPYWPHLLRLSLTPLIIVYWKEALKENQKDIVMPQEGPTRPHSFLHF